MPVSSAGFALYDTPLGRCGIAWRGWALIGLQLPEPSEAAAVARFARRFSGLAVADPPPWVSEAIGRVQRLLTGGSDDLADVPLDFANIAAFETAVYEETRKIRPGRICTYGELAARLGAVGKARAVGQALGRNPWPIVVPCHRVTAADGRTGGFSAPGGRSTKLRLLELEGALAADKLPLFAPPR